MKNFQLQHNVHSVQLKLVPIFHLHKENVCLENTVISFLQIQLH
jgi:hypothetical protein